MKSKFDILSEAHRKVSTGLQKTKDPTQRQNLERELEAYMIEMHNLVGIKYKNTERGSRFRRVSNSAEGLRVLRSALKKGKGINLKELKQILKK